VRFTRIRLQHFKCYDDADLRLDTGVTVIHGLNGSGKSSLLEACFFALYGAKALDQTLDEVVTLGAEEMAVELWFDHANESYHVERQVRVRDGNARTSKCVLDGPQGTIEGATDVRQQITDLLRMDAEAFVNCAYVRQGEVNKLINAAPSDRQDMLDDLLQLGALESYRERASDARVGVGRVLDDKRGGLSEVDEQIETMEEKNLHEQQNTLETKLAAVQEDIERYEENRETAKETLDEANAILEEYEQKAAELEDVEDDIETLRERIQETVEEREAIGEEIQECREECEQLDERREGLLSKVDLDEVSAGASLAESVDEAMERIRAEIDELTESIRKESVQKQEHDSTAERLADEAETLETEAEEKRTEAEELESNLQDASALLAEKREELAELDEEMEDCKAAFEDAPVSFGEAATYRDALSNDLSRFREQRAEVEAELESERERLGDARELKAAGKCPECGQPVEESPHVDAIAEREETVARLEDAFESVTQRVDRLEAERSAAEALLENESTVERLETERANLEQLLDEREANIEEKRERVETLRSEAEEATEEAESKRETAEEAREHATECQEQIAEYNQEKASLTDRLEQLDTLADVIGNREELDAKIETLQEQRTEKERINEERRERLEEKRDRRDDLESSLESDRIETARKKRDDAAQYLEDVREKLAELQETRDSLQGKLGGIKKEIETLEELRDRREELAETVEHLESLYGEAEDLQHMYGNLRSELRKQNVETLERMLNETFDLVYQNDTYARIELDDKYQLTVYQKDGEMLDPGQLSGGERALFNLSLRCAIYRLLAEGIEGTAPMPPLILDEPTVFLDSGHVSQLLELIDSMYELGVAQILVVSHDEELVSAADDLVRVQKDSTTNRSTVEREHPSAALIEGDD
jgi:exonuclease SbcC